MDRSVIEPRHEIGPNALTVCFQTSGSPRLKPSKLLASGAVIGLQAEHSRKRFDCLVAFAPVAQGQTQVEMRLGKCRVKARGLGCPLAIAFRFRMLK